MSVQSATQRVLIKVIYNDRVFFFTPEMFSQVNTTMADFQLVGRAEYVYGVSETDHILKNKTISVDTMITDIALSKVIQKDMPKQTSMWDRALDVVNMQLNTTKDNETLLFGHAKFKEGDLVCQGHTLFITKEKAEAVSTFIHKLRATHKVPTAIITGSGADMHITMCGGKFRDARLVIVENVSESFCLDDLGIPETAVCISIASKQ